MKKEFLQENERIRGLMYLTESAKKVQLKTTSYPNVKIDTDATQNDFVSDALLQDIQSAAKAAGVTVTITTAKSGHPSNRTGKPSRHQAGTGIDIAIIDGVGSGGATNATNGNSQFREKATRVAKALESMGYKRNVERGNQKAVLWHTNLGGNHYNHLHISNTAGVSTSSPSTSSSSTSSSSASGSSNASTDTKNSESPNFLQQLFNMFGGIKGNQNEISKEINEAFTKPVLSVRQTSMDSKKPTFSVIPRQPVFSPENGSVTNIIDSSGSNSKILVLNVRHENKDYEVSLSELLPTVSVGERVSKGDVIAYTAGYTMTMQATDRFGQTINLSKFYDENQTDKKSEDKNKEETSQDKGFNPYEKDSSNAKPFSFHPADVVTTPINIASNILKGVFKNISDQNKKALERAKKDDVAEDINKMKKYIKTNPRL